MKKRVRLFLSLLLCFSLILPVFLQVKRADVLYAEDIDLSIRIGVLYSTKAVATATVASMSGGTAGIVKDLKYTPVFSFSSSTKIVAKKISGSCIVIGDGYESYDKCKKALSELDEFVSNGGPTPSPSPTPSPTPTPSPSPTLSPSPTPTPTEETTQSPSSEPTEDPTNEPTGEPSNEPTPVITPEPTIECTVEPTVEPTVTPTAMTTEAPTSAPTVTPTAQTTTDPNVPAIISDIEMPATFYVYTGSKWYIAVNSVEEDLEKILDGYFDMVSHTYGSNSIEVCGGSTRKYILSVDDKAAKVRIEPGEPTPSSEYPPLLESVQSSTYSVFYRGAFELHRQSKGNINVINVVDVEDYLYAVVPSEMSSGKISQYEERIEALKAQAILARTVAYKNIVYDGINANEVNITTTDQAYKGYMVVNDGSVRVYESSNGSKAVDQTRGQVLFYHGEMIDSVLYSDNNGGITEDSTNVWNGSPRDYYQIAPDPWTVAANDDNWTVEFTGKTINDKIIAVVGSNIGEVKYINIIERSGAGRITNTEIVGTKGTTNVLRGNNRGLLGLKAQLYDYNVPYRFTPVYTQEDPGNYLTEKAKYIFEGKYYTLNYIGDQYAIIGDDGFQYERITVYPNSETQRISVTGGGYGHSVGLSQDGALYASANGIKCEEILDFYYPGTEIGNFFGE